MIAVVLLLLVAGCSRAVGITPSGSPAGSGRLVVTQEMGKGGPMYIEGYVPFVTVMHDGDEVFSARMQFDQPLARDLAAGAYELTFVVHPCDGNCGYLDPPAETCSASFVVAAGQTLRVHAVERPGRGCSLQIPA